MIALIPTDFPGARGARDQEVRHLRQIRDDRPALEVEPQRHRQEPLLGRPLLVLQQLAQHHDARLRVRHLDAHHVPPGNAGHADGARAHLERQVVGEVHQPVHLDAGPEPDAVLRHHRPGGAAGHVALDLELGQRLLEPLLQGVELAFAGIDALGARGREQLHIPDGAEILFARGAPRLGLLRRPALGRLAVALARSALLSRLRHPELLAASGGILPGRLERLLRRLACLPPSRPSPTSGLARRPARRAGAPAAAAGARRTWPGSARRAPGSPPAPRRPRRCPVRDLDREEAGDAPTIRPRNRSRSRGRPR